MSSSGRPPNAPSPPLALALTGERTLPGIPDERYWFTRHVVAYERAAAHVSRLAGAQDAPVVLDAGCGEGYGLAMLAAAGAQRVVGVDLDPAAVAHARATYAEPDPRIELVAAELMSLPLEDDEVDVTVSFQVIEHLHDIPGYLASLRRVTAPGGALLLATPNRLTFTPGSEVPVNPFHTREYTATELATELSAAGFLLDSMWGVHHGSRLERVEADRGATIPELLTAAEPEAWDAALRSLVHTAHSSWFEVRDDDLDASLDLLAVCRVPGP